MVSKKDRAATSESPARQAEETRRVQYHKTYAAIEKAAKGRELPPVRASQ